MIFSKKPEIKLNAIMEGELLKIEDVWNPDFSRKKLGDGYAVLPCSNLVYSPIDGIVETVFRTKHAYLIRADEGVNIIIHLGIDTVELEGKGFDVFVEEGLHVKANDVLGSMDIDMVKSLGKQVTSMCIVASKQEVELLNDLDMLKVGDVVAKIVGES